MSTRAAPVQSAKINQSLLALGRVITHLAEKPAAGRVSRQHVPYRDSNLTRLLQPVLGGNSTTAIIATVAPGRSSLENTKATLHFVSVAAQVRPRPRAPSCLLVVRTQESLVLSGSARRRQVGAGYRTVGVC